jgi:glutathione S-transferase
MRLALYHNALSSCSQKVRLALDEKGLEFESRVIDLLAGQQHDPEYVKLNPSHVVPTLLDGDRVLLESTLINEYLEDAFPDHPLLPSDPADRHAARLWVKRIDEQVHTAAGPLTYAVGPRKMILARPEAEREAQIDAIPDPARRAARRSVIQHGVKAPEFVAALGRFLDLLDDMQAHLEASPWLTGERFGLADAAALPYVLRLDTLAMTPLIDARARVADWLSRVQSRPSYAKAVDAWLPKPVVELMRNNGREVWADVEPLTRR